MTLITYIVIIYIYIAFEYNINDNSKCFSKLIENNFCEVVYFF